MKRTTVLLAFGAALAVAGAANAQTAGGTTGGTTSATQPKPPLGQASESVGKNLARDPDNRGLQNAQRRITTNQQRIEAKRAAQGEKRATRTARGTDERTARASVERPGRPDHPARGR